MTTISEASYHASNNIFERCESSADLILAGADFASSSIRSGGSELHNISALTGGMVAQEAIKIITKQYIPVDNVCLFDGITSKTGVFRL